MTAENRCFFICRSKNCRESKLHRARCTLSVPNTALTFMVANDLNERRFCVFYTHSLLLNNTNTPNWQLSPQKPGQRNQNEKAKSEYVGIDSSEFLEVI